MILLIIRFKDWWHSELRPAKQIQSLLKSITFSASNSSVSAASRTPVKTAVPRYGHSNNSGKFPIMSDSSGDSFCRICLMRYCSSVGGRSKILMERFGRKRVPVRCSGIVNINRTRWRYWSKDNIEVSLGPWRDVRNRRDGWISTAAFRSGNVRLHER